MTRPSAPTADSSARVTVVPTATTRWPAPRVALTWRAVWSPTSNRSGCGPSPASCDDTPVCSVTGATAMPRATSLVTSVGGERPPGRRHLGAAGDRREDRLVGRERVRPVEVAVGDRAAVQGDVPCQGAADAGAPEPVALAGGGGAVVRVGRDQLDGDAVDRPPAPPSAGRRDARPSTARSADGAVRSSTTQLPSSRGVARCSTRTRPRPSNDVDLPGDGRGVVDDHEVARGEVVGEVGEPTVAEAVRPRHQQPYVVARGAARLGRAVGDVLARLREDRGGDSCSTVIATPPPRAGRSRQRGSARRAAAGRAAPAAPGPRSRAGAGR